MKNTNSTRTLVYRAVLLFCVILLASAVSACRPKDIVSLAKLDKGDLYVGDEFGNAWFVNDPADILSALKISAGSLTNHALPNSSPTYRSPLSSLARDTMSFGLQADTAEARSMTQNSKTAL